MKFCRSPARATPVISSSLILGLEPTCSRPGNELLVGQGLVWDSVLLRWFWRRSITSFVPNVASRWIHPGHLAIFLHDIRNADRSGDTTQLQARREDIVERIAGNGDGNSTSRYQIHTDHMTADHREADDEMVELTLYKN